MARRITAQRAKNPTFTVEAVLTFEIEGERFTDTYKIIYNGLSARIMRELLDDVPDEGDEITEENRNAVAAQLAQLVADIPDITNDEGTGPATFDAAFFDGLTLHNLKAINDAVRNDINPPKAQPDC
jgi:hypothetical protein